MQRRRFLIALAGMTLSACTRSPGTGGAPTVVPIGATGSDLLGLIYWDAGASWAADPSDRQVALVDGLLRSRDTKYLPYLLDLATVPNPYDAQVIAGLRQWLGNFGATARPWFDHLGAQTPADDSPEYLRFKQALYATIQSEYGAWLDPVQPHTISAQEVRWGGVGIDGIPPLEEPALIDVASARAWALDSDEVIGIELNGDARCYPRRIIDWHEMVNDTVGGTPVSLAYCTLCNSAILYDGRVGDRVYRFGTSGLLYRSNKLMYDRTTRSLWGQYSGAPVWGGMTNQGLKLRYLSAVHTTFGAWVAQHPATKVLDIETGFARDYGSGVAYADYWASPDLMFPVAIDGGSIDPKAPVFAVRLGDETVAYPISQLVESEFVHDTVAGTAIVVLRTADGSGGRAYEVGQWRVTSWDFLTSTATTRDRTWLLTEDALVSGPDSLPRVPGHNSFWFAVANHTEGGRLYSP